MTSYYYCQTDGEKTKVPHGACVDQTRPPEAFPAERAQHQTRRKRSLTTKSYRPM